MSVEYKIKKLISNWGISISAKQEGKVRSLVLLCLIKKKKRPHEELRRGPCPPHKMLRRPADPACFTGHFPSF